MASSRAALRKAGSSVSIVETIRHGAPKMKGDNARTQSRDYLLT